MKKRIIAALVASIMVSAPVFADCGWATQYGYTDKLYYPECGLIVSIEDETPVDSEDPLELITFRCQNGNEFSFLSDSGDWFINDIVTAIMSTCGTNCVFDDEVLDVKYGGWVSDEEALKWVK